MKHLLSITEYTRNPQYLKSIFKKIYRGVYKITGEKLEYKIKDDKHNDINYTDVLKDNYLYLEFEIQSVDQMFIVKVDKYLDSFRKQLENQEIILSYYKSGYNRQSMIDLVNSLYESTKTEYYYHYYIYIKDNKGQRIKPPKYVYHATNKKNSDSISKNGIKISPPKNYKGNADLEYMPSIFAMADKKNVWSNEDIWQIDTTKIPNKWWQDLNLHNRYKDAIMTFDDIPPNTIEKI